MTAENRMCEEATGCVNSGGFREFAEEAGYPHCHVLDWTSSAGDWSFIVSEDGLTWHLMFQENRWPRQGFHRTIDNERCFFGTAKEVLTEICELVEIGIL